MVLLVQWGRGIPNNIGGTFQTNVYRNLNKNPFAGETVIYPEDLGSNDQGHYVQFYINEQENANVNFGGQGKESSITSKQETLVLPLHK